MKYPAIAVANEIIKLSKAENVPVTPMKLQKILYLATGVAYKRLDNKLIKERFEAWDYGPVVADVYNAFKKYGGKSIKEPSDDLLHERGFSFVSASSIVVEDDSLDAIKEAWNGAKNLDAFTLSAWSHNKDSPWDKAYNSNPRQVYISDEEMKQYFLDFIKE